MAQFQFSVGQQVRVSLTVSSLAGAFKRQHDDGIFTILRCLPSDTKQTEYRVRSDSDGHERVISQAEIRSAVAR